MAKDFLSNEKKNNERFKNLAHTFGFSSQIGILSQDSAIEIASDSSEDEDIKIKKAGRPAGTVMKLVRFAAENNFLTAFSCRYFLAKAIRFNPSGSWCWLAAKY